MAETTRAMKTLRRLWRRRGRTTFRRAYAPLAATATFTRFMYGALRNRRFTGDEEKEGRKRWGAIYDASVKVLRSMGIK